MPQNQRKVGLKEQRWKEKAPSAKEGSSAVVAETTTRRLGGLSIESGGEARPLVQPVRFGNFPLPNQGPVPSQKAVWKQKSSYATTSGAEAVGGQRVPAETAAVANRKGGNSHSLAQIRAAFYPKFENEKKTDNEVRNRMIETVSEGSATMEVSLKHSGSLFMYAGPEGGAYAKNSFGNIYTAVGVFVLGRMFREAWGTKAAEKQVEFNGFLEKNRLSISMELVTAVLGDHGQLPLDDYVVVTAVTELGNGQPKFYSTPEVIAFCRKWRLPTNHIWLFSTRKSATSFFALYDALCEEGTATTVCKALDEVADISIPGSKDHLKVQGEILEGLVARIVSRDSAKHMEEVLKDYPPPPADGVGLDLGPSLRDIFREHRKDDKQQIEALLQNVGASFCPDHSDWYGSGDAHSRNADNSVVSKFLESHYVDESTRKLQEMIRVIKKKKLPAAFKCYQNSHKVGSKDNISSRVVIHVRSDSAFRRYQKEMRDQPGLWPLYRGFFVDINLFSEERAAEIAKNINDKVGNVNGSGSIPGGDGLADDDRNLMVKLKFLTYKIRTFLIRNGLSILFKGGQRAYKEYYERQMKIWATSREKQSQLSKMLDEWATYIRRKCGNNPLKSSIYLSEAEPFLEQYAKRSPQNQALIGSAGNLVRSEEFMAIIDGGFDEEGDLSEKQESVPTIPVEDTVQKHEGLIVFFPGIPGCAKSALCNELLNAPGGLGDDRPIQSLMGDRVEGRYWPMVKKKWNEKPHSIMLADKNAPNEEVWTTIADMCVSTRASAVPVVPESEGTDSNPFSLDALAVFMFRVLQRANHPGNLDKSSRNAGYVLLMFYHLYEGKSRRDFEDELVDRFGTLVKMPLLRSDRSPLPEPVRSTLEEGINLYKLHTQKYRKLDPHKGTYAKQWDKWENQFRATFSANANYFNSIQVPFEVAVQQVKEQLRNVAKGNFVSPFTEKKRIGAIIFAAISLPVPEIRSFLVELAGKNSKVEAFLKDKQLETNLNKAHVTLAHKRSHGVAAVANYGMFIDREVPVELTAILFTNKVAALEARLGSVDGEQIEAKNEWPHVTIWTAAGVKPKEANELPQLHSEGKATLVEINPPVTISGPLEFF